MRALSILILVPLLAACGFAPVYGERPAGAGKGVQDVFASIEVEQAHDRLSQQLRNGLVNQLTPRGYPREPRYTLSVDLSEEVEGFGIRPDRSISRERVEMSADFRLLDVESGEPVFEDTARAWVSYDVVQSDFANINAQRDARRRAAEHLVDRIVGRLAAHFRKSAATAAAPAEDRP